MDVANAANPTKFRSQVFDLHSHVLTGRQRLCWLANIFAAVFDVLTGNFNDCTRK